MKEEYKLFSEPENPLEQEDTNEEEFDIENGGCKCFTTNCFIFCILLLITATMVEFGFVTKKPLVVALSWICVIILLLYGLYIYLSLTPKNISLFTDIEQITNELYCRNYLIHYFGATFFARMTIIDLNDGRDGYAIHSPSPYDNTCQKFLSHMRKIKPNFHIKYLIAPGNYHYFNIIEWSQEYPLAKVYICPGVEKKLEKSILSKEFRYDGILTKDVDDKEFLNHFDCVFTDGFKNMKEVVLYHKESETLTLTDLVENIGDKTPGINKCLKIYWYLFKMWNIAKPAPEYQYSIENKDIVKQVLNEKILNNLQWNFKNIILSHGENYMPNDNAKCKEFLRRAWQDLL